MGYNERNPIFSFRLGEYRHGKINKLAKLEKMPAADLVRKIIDQWLSGNLIEKSNDDTANEHAKLKLLKLKAEIEYLQLKNNLSLDNIFAHGQTGSIKSCPNLNMEQLKTDVKKKKIFQLIQKGVLVILLIAFLIYLGKNWK